MRDFAEFALIFFYGLTCLAIGFAIGYSNMKKKVVERDLMTQCVGESGWHWECEPVE